MNRIKVYMSADLSLLAFCTAAMEVQKLDGEAVPILVVSHPKDNPKLLGIVQHFRALKEAGHRAEGAFILPPSVNAWYHEGLEEGAWMVMGRDNFVFVEAP